MPDLKPLRVAILLSHPTQFDGPLFRYAHGAGGAQLTVLYLSSNTPAAVFDPELGRTIDWGIDLLGGYEHKHIPATGRIGWLWKELECSRYDCLIVNGYSRVVYLAATVIAATRGIRTGLRIDSVLFNNTSRWRRLLKRAAYMFLFRLYDRFFATGTLARDYLMHFGVAPRRISLFPYTVDTQYFANQATQRASQRMSIRERLGIPSDARVILAVAKLGAREAPWDLLRALRGLDLKECWTIIAGDGEERGALQAFAAAHLEGRVVFPGYIPYADLVSMYVSADLFVHAADNEPWGVSVHEAIACGLPVVASSRVGAAYDLIRPGRNGYMYATGDSNDLCDKLKLALGRTQGEHLLEANREVLEDWNYASTWRAIVAGCDEAMRGDELKGA